MKSEFCLGMENNSGSSMYCNYTKKTNGNGLKYISLY